MMNQNLTATAFLLYLPAVKSVTSKRLTKNNATD